MRRPVANPIGLVTGVSGGLLDRPIRVSAFGGKSACRTGSQWFIL